MKTFSDLVLAVLKLFPEAQIMEDNDGQIIIYTNLSSKDGRLEGFQPGN